jgi:small-conductance mechanosensitive channel
VTDPVLQAVERNSLVIGAAMTVAALFVRPRPQLAIAVAAGAFLVSVSYWTLKRGVTTFAALVAKTPDAAQKTRPNAARELWKLVLRYALLALLAYVMIARLRLHPWGLLAGASSVVAGVSLEAVRLLTKE